MTARAVLDASGAVHLVLNGQYASHLAAKLEDVNANYDAVLPTGNTSNQTVSAGLRIRF